MKKAEDLAMRIIRNGIMWEEEISIQDTAALIRADREEVIEECINVLKRVGLTHHRKTSLADGSQKEKNMANWGIASTASEIEKIKSEMADYLHGLNSCAEIDYSVYSQLFDFSLPLLQKAYELGKKEAQQLLQPDTFGAGQLNVRLTTTV